jgi:DUF4097 and DUF4098 domain-containing protein YvlB
MKMKRLGGVSVAALVLALAIPAAAAQQEFDWSGTVAAGKAVEIKGINGGIEATGTSGSEITLHAVKKGKKSDPSGVKIEVVEHAGGVTICAVYPSTGEPNECKPGEGGRMSVKKNDVSVEFEVGVPAGVRFIGRTVNGGISARGIQAKVEAHTVNGGIEIEAVSLAHAETVNGGISARIDSTARSEKLKLKTVNGGIEVSLPGDAAADVKAATVNGHIETDFPLTVKGKIGRRRIEGSIGGGGPLLEMETVNGSIELNKST